MQLIRDIALPILYLRAKKYSDFLNSAKSDHVDLEDSNSSLKYFLDKYDFHVDQEVFDKIAVDDFIEVYDRYAVQIYRSYSIFKYSSFDMEELFEKRMDQLYSRLEIYNKMLFRAADKIYARKSKMLTDFCPNHVVVERKEDPRSVEIGYKFLAPLYDDLGNIVGVVCCETLKLLPKDIGVSESADKVQSHFPQA